MEGETATAEAAALAAGGQIIDLAVHGGGFNSVTIKIKRRCCRCCVVSLV